MRLAAAVCLVSVALAWNEPPMSSSTSLACDGVAGCAGGPTTTSSAAFPDWTPSNQNSSTTTTTTTTTTPQPAAETPGPSACGANPPPAPTTTTTDTGGLPEPSPQPGNETTPSYIPSGSGWFPTPTGNSSGTPYATPTSTHLPSGASSQVGGVSLFLVAAGLAAAVALA